MNIAEAQVLLAGLAVSRADARVEAGTAGTPPHNYAYLKLTSLADPSDVAILSTPGIGWYELGVSGGSLGIRVGNFTYGHTDDLATDQFVREYLEDLLSAANAYLDGHWRLETSRLLKIPRIQLQTNSGTLTLRLSIQGGFEYLRESLAKPRKRP